MIELHAASPDTSPPGDATADTPPVEIHIHPKKLTAGKRRHLLLVIKLHQNVVCKVRTTALRGTLDLIVSTAR